MRRCRIPQVAAFLETLRAANARVSVTLAFEFTILCAARTSETLHATWPEIDRETKTWTIPVSA